MTDDTLEGLNAACKIVGAPLAQNIVADVSKIVSEAINAAFSEKGESGGFYPQVVKPYVTAYVYETVADELRTRAEQHDATFHAAVQRRYRT